MPFFLSASFIFFVIYIFKLRSPFFSNSFILYTALTLGFFAFFFRFKKLAEKNKIRNIIVEFCKPFFLMNLFLITILNIENWTTLTRNLIEKINPWLIILSVFSGIIVLYINKDRIEQDAEKEQRSALDLEEKKDQEFRDKFPKLNSIPFFNIILRSIYRNGILYSALVILLTIMGITIRLYHLGSLSFWWDEIITSDIVKMIRNSGIPLEPSGLVYYTRGFLYHYLITFITFIFGISEFSIRFLSVISGILIAVIAFLFTKKYNKWLALFLFTFLVFSTYNIEFSRFARFYIFNSFLFISAFYVGYHFIIQPTIKKMIILLFLFFAMIFTVAFGKIFIAITGGIIICHLIKNNGSFSYKKEENKMMLHFLMISGFIFILSLIFPDIIKNTTLEFSKNIPDLNIIERSMPLISAPKWHIFNFFKNNYFYSLVIPAGIIFFINTIILCKKKNHLSVFYLMLVTAFSVLTYELFNKGVTGSRIILFIEPLILFIVLFSINNYLKLFFTKNRILRGISLTVICILLFINIKPNFYERVTTVYGQDLREDPFRNVDIIAYRANYKDMGNYIKTHLQKNDIWININYNSFYYTDNNPDFIFNQHPLWNTDSIYTEGNFIDFYSGSILINSVEQLKEILKNNSHKNIYISANGGSLNIINTRHINDDFRDFLDSNKERIVFKSNDGYGSILLFSK